MRLGIVVTLQHPALPHLRARVRLLLRHQLRLTWLRRLLLLVPLQYVTTLEPTCSIFSWGT